ncbi:hypothetical protein [Arenivirga flava]|uniref:Uncharacterized protein n=1 Tax=Arenivirga flava TaxID=1930060 RepID=A0AA37UMI2_9MICO|nr:hypothetical protein [Arenivirga flava]GMA26788.1 hypothetical protein GCM10025874_00410 [Arenivirga flava]GMA29903.1 hypothetical protein GCM10025874_31560 [Arenivirga flava]GMA29968.1 hypothetical protein GCM10025874_32210 [Arenivirga flava]
MWNPADYFGAGQLFVAILGFGIAIWQLVRTADATVESTRLLGARLLANDLLVLLPELEALEDAVHSAVKSEDADKVGIALAKYARRAQRVHGHLTSSPVYEGVVLVGLINESVEACRDAKQKLYDKPKVNIIPTVRAARQSIDKVVLEAASFSATLQKGTESGNNRRKRWFGSRRSDQ